MSKPISLNMNGIPDAYEIASEILTSGRGPAKPWHAFTSGIDQFQVGRWSNGPCELHVNCTEDELFLIVEDNVTLTGSDSSRTCHVKGDALLLSSEFSGAWKCREVVTKAHAALAMATLQ